MKTRTLGQGLQVSALGFGSMGMSASYGVRQDVEEMQGRSVLDVVTDSDERADMARSILETSRAEKVVKKAESLEAAKRATKKSAKT